MKGRETIQEMAAKGKAVVALGIAEWGLFCLVMLAVLLSFGLGRLSALIESKPLIQVNRAQAQSQAAMAAGGLLVAARTGQTYYFPWCSGAQKIAPQNEVWFKSEKAARAAGYRPAKNCKGLE